MSRRVLRWIGIQTPRTKEPTRAQREAMAQAIEDRYNASTREA